MVAPCNAWQRWNSKSCSCDCLGSVSSCNSVQKWNVTACSCDCLALPRCVGGSLFNRTTCRCSASASNFLSSTIDTSPRQLPWFIMLIYSFFMYLLGLFIKPLNQLLYSFDVSFSLFYFFWLWSIFDLFKELDVAHISEILRQFCIWQHYKTPTINKGRELK